MGKEKYILVKNFTNKENADNTLLELLNKKYQATIRETDNGTYDLCILKGTMKNDLEIIIDDLSILGFNDAKII